MGTPEWLLQVLGFVICLSLGETLSYFVWGVLYRRISGRKMDLSLLILFSFAVSLGKALGYFLGGCYISIAKIKRRMKAKEAFKNKRDEL